MTEAIIFDCDGTLVDSEGLGSQVLVDVLAEHGVEMHADHALERFRGRRLADCLGEIEAQSGLTLSPAFVPQFRARSAQVFRSQLKPMAGALDLVRSLNLPRAVASSGPREKTELSLSITGLLPYFEQSVFSCYDVGAWKPDPSVFLHAARTLGVRPEACIVVEDSLPGIHAGIAAGMRVFALQPHALIGALPATVVVLQHLSDLSAYLT